MALLRQEKVERACFFAYSCYNMNGTLKYAFEIRALQSF